MRILFVHNYYLIGGGEDAVLASEMELLKQQGHEVFTLFAHNTKVSRLEFTLRFLFQSTWSAHGKKRMAAAIRETRPDLIHVHNWFPLFSPSIFDAAIEAGIPIIQTLHNYRILYPNAYLFDGKKVDDRTIKGSAWVTVRDKVYHNSMLATAVMAFMIEFHRKRDTWNRKVDRFIVLTDFSRRVFEQFGIKLEKMVLKPNFVADPGMRTDTEKPAETVFLFTGRLSDEKGILLLCEAWKKAKAPGKLVIIGDGQLAPQVEQFADERTLVLGKTPFLEVLNWMKKASYLVFPSMWYEGFPRVLVEAFATGLPVISSDIGSQASLIKEGETGFLFKNAQEKDLAMTLEKAAALKPEVWEKLSLNGRTLYESAYTPEKNAKALEEIYRSVITQKAGER